MSVATRAVLAQLVPVDVAVDDSRPSFSVLELNSGSGALSMRVAQAFDAATVISVDDDAALTQLHVDKLARANVTNNYVCATAANADLLKKLYKAPEFVRFQVRTLRFTGCCSWQW